MADHLVHFVERLGQWGYLIVFVFIALEGVALVGLFMPAESVVLLSGFLAAQGLFDLGDLIFVIAAGAIVGDSIGFELGRKLGRGWLERHGPQFGVRRERLEGIEMFFAQHGRKSVFTSHFIHLGRALMPFMAGSSRMPYLRFFIFNALGCALWATTFALLGYFVGESWHLAEKWIGQASAIVGATLLLILGMTWLWRWLIRHETKFRQQWARFIAQPKIVEWRRRFAPHLQFLQDRLTPGGYLGLHLTIGAVVIILGCWWFGGVVEDLLSRDPLVQVDAELAVWLNEHATQAVTRVARAVTFLGSTTFLACASTAIALLLMWRRHWYRLLTLVITMGGGALLNIALKSLFHRDRPVLENSIETFSSYSFPSGHAMGATLFYGVIALFVAAHVERWRLRVLVLLIASLVILLIAASRIYLGAHYLSDVMGAMAAAIVWLASCQTAVEIIKPRNQSLAR